MRGERFVELDQVDLVERQAGKLEHLLDCGNRADAKQLGRHAGSREGDESGEWFQPARFGVSLEVTTTAAAPSLVCDELPAVTVP